MRAMNPRPVSVMVLSVVGILMSLMYLICCSCNAFTVGAVFLIPEMAQEDAQMAALQGQPVGAMLIFLCEMLSLLLAVVLLVCSCGALAMKQWARTGMIYWAILNLVMNVAVVGMRMMFLGGTIIQEAQAQTAGQPLPPGAIMIVVVLVIGLVLVLLSIYPALVLFFFTRQEIKYAFEGHPTGGYYAPPPGYGGYPAPYGEQPPPHNYDPYGQQQQPPPPDDSNWPPPGDRRE